MAIAEKRTPAQRPHAGRKRPPVKIRGADPIVAARLAHAIDAVKVSGRLSGARSKRVSVRLDPGLVEAAKANSGIENDSDLINAALAAVAAPDDFGPWFVTQAGTLPADFEIDF
jgi:hypothetical protein